MAPDRAFLFSGAALRSIEYMAVAGDGRTTEIDFDEGSDPHKGVIREQFEQRVEWDNSLVFELVIQDHESGNGAGGTL